MFTGLVEARAPARRLEVVEAGARLVVAPPERGEAGEDWRPRPGESISVSGCCLTVARATPDGTTEFDLSAETLERTWFAEIEPGRALNLERSLRLGDRLGGHLVSGHVDGVGRIVESSDSNDGGRLFTFEVPAGFERYLVEKGSIAIDGISLTVVSPRGRIFDVAVIPETLRRTNLGEARPGQRVHLEADQIGKWIERLLAERQ